MRERWTGAHGLGTLLCCELLLGSLIGCGGTHRTTLPETKPPSAVFEPLWEELKKPYLTLFETAATLEFTDPQIAKMREYLNQGEDYCLGKFKGIAKEYQRRVEAAQNSLNKDIPDAERHNLHCEIQVARDLKLQADLISQHAIPVAYDNKRAKLDVIQKWPAEANLIRQSIADGKLQEAPLGRRKRHRLPRD